MNISDYAVEDFAAGGATAHGVADGMKSKSMTDDELKAKLYEFFPPVDPMHQAVGTRVLFQLKKIPEKTRGGIILAPESRDADQRATVYAKVVSIGGAAFYDAQNGKKYGDDYGVGDYVRIPKWGKDEFVVDGVTFCFFNWWDAIGKVNPRIVV